MAKKQLSRNELHWQELLPQLTKYEDPCSQEWSSLNTELDTAIDKHDKAVDELQKLPEVKKLPRPKPTVANTAETTFGLTAVVVIALFLFHCVIWMLKLLFDISWDTWSWTVHAFFWGIGLSVLATIIAVIYDNQKQQEFDENLKAWKVYDKKKTELEKEIDYWQSEYDRCNRLLEVINKERKNVLKFGVNNVLAIPCPLSAITDSNYQDIKSDYLKIKEKQDHYNELKAQGQNPQDLMRVIMDLKLDFLYRWSLKAEVNSSVYIEFQRMLNAHKRDDMARRQDLPAERSKGVRLIGELPECKRLLEDDTLTPIVNRFEAVMNRDTTKNGLLFFMEDSGKKAQQTRDMQELAKAAKQEYDELMDVNEKVSYALDFARGYAYRNIYLGTELLNYARSKKGGGSLTKMQDGTDMISIQTDGLQMDVSSLNVDLSDTALTTLSAMGTAVVNNKDLQKLVKENPKVSLGIAAVATIGNVAESYFSNLNANAEAQQKMTEAIRKISDGYVEGKANMLRAIEIIEAIVKCNEGFMNIYLPLQKKVFEEKDAPLTRNDILLLASAINKYKKVSDSKIK